MTATTPYAPWRPTPLRRPLARRRTLLTLPPSWRRRRQPPLPKLSPTRTWRSTQPSFQPAKKTMRSCRYAPPTRRRRFAPCMYASSSLARCGSSAFAPAPICAPIRGMSRCRRAAQSGGRSAVRHRANPRALVRPARLAALYVVCTVVASAEHHHSMANRAALLPTSR